MNKDNLIIISTVFVLLLAVVSFNNLTITGKIVDDKGQEIPFLMSACTGSFVSVTPSPVSSNDDYDLRVQIKNTGQASWYNGAVRRIIHKLKIIEGPGKDDLIGFNGANVKGIRQTSEAGVLTPPVTANFIISRKAPEVSAASSTPINVNFKFQMVEEIRPSLWRRTAAALIGQTLESEFRPFGPECSYTLRVDRLDAEFLKQNPTDDTSVIQIFNPVLGPMSSSSPDTSLVASEKYLIRVKLKNKGTTVWKSGDNYKLEGQVGLQNNPQTVQLELLQEVKPEQEVSLQYIGTAPDSTGQFSTKWQMKIGERLFGTSRDKNSPVTSRNDDALCGINPEPDIELRPMLSESIVVSKIYCYSSCENRYPLSTQLSLLGNCRWACDNNGQSPPSLDRLSIVIKNIKNSGNTIWRTGEYKLVGVDQSRLFGNIEFDMPEREVLPGIAADIKGIPPNSILRYGYEAATNRLVKTIDVNSLTSSSQPGVYTLGFRMKHGNEEFGPVCSKQIKIEPYFSAPREINE